MFSDTFDSGPYCLQEPSDLYRRIFSAEVLTLSPGHFGGDDGDDGDERSDERQTVKSLLRN